MRRSNEKGRTNKMVKKGWNSSKGSESDESGKLGRLKSNSECQAWAFPGRTARQTRLKLWSPTVCF